MDVQALSAGGRLTIDLQNLVLNYQTVARRVALAQVAAVVKADAYGLGADAVIRALESAGCRIFFVAHLSEAVKVRGISRDDSDIFVLNGLSPGAEPICAQARCTPVLNTLDQVERWNNLGVASPRPLPAAIQLDSGMARLGLGEDETRFIAADPARLAGVDLRLIMSHLACADIPGAEAYVSISWPACCPWRRSPWPTRRGRLARHRCITTSCGPASASMAGRRKSASPTPCFRW
jgi:alanine racemase